MEHRLKYYITNEQIYRFYFGEFSLSKKYNSPFRKDPGPSLMFKDIGRENQTFVIWTDFGKENIKHRDGVGFVSELFGLSREDAAHKIFNEIIVKNKVPTHVKLEPMIKSEYTATKRRFTVREMGYWLKRWFTSEFLEFFNVHALATLKKDGVIRWMSTDSIPAYLYLFKENISAFKAYRPTAEFDRFRGVNNGNIIEGYDQLPPIGDVLFINSSLKDTMIFRKLGYLSINGTSENSIKAIIDKIPELNQRFKKIYILFDNDKPGIKASFRLWKLTKWEMVFVPKWEGFKDPDDVVTKIGNYFILNKLFGKGKFML